VTHRSQRCFLAHSPVVNMSEITSQGLEHFEILTTHCRISLSLDHAAAARSDWLGIISRSDHGLVDAIAHQSGVSQRAITVAL